MSVCVQFSDLAFFFLLLCLWKLQVDMSWCLECCLGVIWMGMCVCFSGSPTGGFCNRAQSLSVAPRGFAPEHGLSELHSTQQTQHLLGNREQGHSELTTMVENYHYSLEIQICSLRKMPKRLKCFVVIR